jgi:hypothetical protein
MAHPSNMSAETIGTTLGWWLLRWASTKGPEWIARRIYPDANLARDVRIEPMGESEGATLRLETIYGVPRLVVSLNVENVSPYRAVIVHRLIGSIERVVTFIDEGWASDDPLLPRCFIDVSLTSEQDSRLRQMASGSINIKGTAILHYDGRAVTKSFEIPTRLVHVTA